MPTSADNFEGDVAEGFYVMHTLQFKLIEFLSSLFYVNRLLEAKPELQDKFPGKLDIEKLKTTRILFGHNKILMTSIENAVTSVDDNESFRSYLVELGRRHQVRPLKAEHLEASFLFCCNMELKRERI